MFSQMYTSQGTGDILVRICGSWENFVVHLRTFRRISNKGKSALCLFMPSAPLTRPADFLNVLMHVDMFSGMYTSQGSGDILVRMCGSWENFVVHLRTFRALYKQLTILCLLF